MSSQVNSQITSASTSNSSLKEKKSDSNEKTVALRVEQVKDSVLSNEEPQNAFSSESNPSGIDTIYGSRTSVNLYQTPEERQSPLETAESNSRKRKRDEAEPAAAPNQLSHLSVVHQSAPYNPTLFSNPPLPIIYGIPISGNIPVFTQPVPFFPSPIILVPSFFDPTLSGFPLYGIPFPMGSIPMFGPPMIFNQPVYPQQPLIPINYEQSEPPAPEVYTPNALEIQNAAVSSNMGNIPMFGPPMIFNQPVYPQQPLISINYEQTEPPATEAYTSNALEIQNSAVSSNSESSSSHVINLEEPNLEEQPNEIIQLFQNQGLTYISDVYMDSKYQANVSKIWETHPKMLLSESKQRTNVLNCIQGMKNDASDVYAQSIEIKKIAMKLQNGTEMDGYGVFAKKVITKNEIIGIYSGEFLPLEMIEDKDYVFEFSDEAFENWGIDAKKEGNFTRFINHSNKKNENVVADVYYIREIPRIVFIAKRKILKDAQLLINYGSDYWKRKGIEPSILKPFA